LESLVYNGEYSIYFSCMVKKELWIVVMMLYLKVLSYSYAVC
jgi:hypothetical protein